MMQTEDERMVDRPEAKTGSYTDSVLVKMRNTGSMDQIETCMVPILSDPIRVSPHSHSPNAPTLSPLPVEEH